MAKIKKNNSQSPPSIEEHETIASMTSHRTPQQYQCKAKHKCKDVNEFDNFKVVWQINMILFQKELHAYKNKQLHDMRGTRQLKIIP